uniref:Homeobox domain-containing protein n=1 Tax=Macrostomum lignano TaxID=282301 RepID=A0A1I8FKT7_9PLAT
HQWKPASRTGVEFHAVNSLHACRAAPPGRPVQKRFGLDVARWCRHQRRQRRGRRRRRWPVAAIPPAFVESAGHQKVRLWLSNFCDSRSLSKSAPSASMALADSNSPDHLAPAGPAKRRGPGLRRQRTFLGRLWRLLLTRSSRGPLLNCPKQPAAAQAQRREPQKPEVAARTSLNRLLLNRLSLLSNSTPTPELGALKSARTQNATREFRRGDWLRHNSELTASSGGKTQPQSGGRNKSGEVVHKPSGRRLPHPVEDDDGGDDSGTGSSTPSARNLVRHPEPYHVAHPASYVLPGQRVQLTADRITDIDHPAGCGISQAHRESLRDDAAFDLQTSNGHTVADYAAENRQRRELLAGMRDTIRR